MGSELLQIPAIPEGLREAALRGNLIPFIGAGASMLAECPGWDEFADAALSWLIDQGKLSHSHVEQIRHLNARVKLSLARAIATDNKTPIDYYHLLHRSPPRQVPKGCRLYNGLFALGNIFVTTNYDVWLDDQLPAGPTTAPIPEPKSLPPTPMHIVYRPEEILPSLLTQSNTVIHLHGSVNDPTTMIQTTSDYVRHYAAYERSSRDPQTENRVLTFLDFLFQHRTVLFIGYGLEELEILEYVLAKRQPTKGEAKHYLLAGFFSYQEALRRSLATYYQSECGIELIPFRRDEKNWDQLLDVIEAWAKHMPATTPLVLQEMRDMEDLLL